MVLSVSGLSKEYLLTAIRHKVITHVYRIILILDTVVIYAMKNESSTLDKNNNTRSDF